MDLLEFAEKTSPIPLSIWQKEFLKAYEQAQKQNVQFCFCIPRMTGRKMAMDIIRQFEEM